jgi:hypothetical protein
VQPNGSNDLIGRNKGHREMTSNRVSSDPCVATIKKEERIEDLILIKLILKRCEINQLEWMESIEVNNGNGKCICQFIPF